MGINSYNSVNDILLICRMGSSSYSFVNVLLSSCRMEGAAATVLLMFYFLPVGWGAAVTVLQWQVFESVQDEHLLQGDAGTPPEHPITSRSWSSAESKSSYPTYNIHMCTCVFSSIRNTPSQNERRVKRVIVSAGHALPCEAQNCFCTADFSKNYEIV